MPIPHVSAMLSRNNHRMKRPTRLPGFVLSLAMALAMPLSVGAEEGGSPTSPTKSTAQAPSLWNPLTWKWVPTDEEILKYRRMWNPFSAGPIMLSAWISTQRASSPSTHSSFHR